MLPARAGLFPENGLVLSEFSANPPDGRDIHFVPVGSITHCPHRSTPLQESAPDWIWLRNYVSQPQATVPARPGQIRLFVRLEAQRVTFVILPSSLACGITDLRIGVGPEYEALPAGGAEGPCI